MVVESTLFPLDDCIELLSDDGDKVDGGDGGGKDENEGDGVDDGNGGSDDDVTKGKAVENTFNGRTDELNENGVDGVDTVTKGEMFTTEGGEVTDVNGLAKIGTTVDGIKLIKDAPRGTSAIVLPSI